jgi:pimeloyl-ACP methyl ester carboxylesterase
VVVGELIFQKVVQLHKKTPGNIMRKFISLMILVITGITPVIALDNNGERSQKSINSSDHTGTSFEIKYETINDIRIHYLEWDSAGPPIILLHGMNDDAGIWESFAPLLASEYHVIAPDRRGTGSSGKPKDGYNFPTLISDISLLINKLGIGPVILIGHSFGAEIALSMAARQPELIRSVVMIDGGFWPKEENHPSETSSEIERASSEYDPEILYPNVTSPVLLVFARGSGPSKDMLAKLEAQGIDFFEEVRKKEQAAIGLANRKLGRKKIAFIENTSHWIHVDQPQILAETINRFLIDFSSNSEDVSLEKGNPTN